MIRAMPKAGEASLEVGDAFMAGAGVGYFLAYPAASITGFHWASCFFRKSAKSILARETRKNPNGF